MNTPETEPYPGIPWFGWLGLAAILFILLGPMLPMGCDPHRERFGNSVARARVSQVCAALKQYRTEYGAMPAGSQAEIMNTLRGANPRKIVFFEARPQDFNQQGEYIDAWGTPYHIDASTPDYPWAYSYGPDKQDNGGAPGSDDITSWGSPPVD